jgi:uncharacterized membrane protein YtjA (UPF0391 family)
MLRWALIFLVLALAAALFGFAVLAGTAAVMAQAVFLIFMVLFVVGLLMGLAQRRSAGHA